MTQTLAKTIRIPAQQWGGTEPLAADRNLSANQLLVELTMEALDRREWPHTNAESYAARATMFVAPAVQRELIAAGREDELEENPPSDIHNPARAGQRTTSAPALRCTQPALAFRRSGTVRAGTYRADRADLSRRLSVVDDQARRNAPRRTPPRVRTSSQGRLHRAEVVRDQARSLKETDELHWHGTPCSTTRSACELTLQRESEP